MKLKNKIIILIVKIFILICIVGIIYSSYKIIIWKLNVDNNKKIDSKLHENIEVDTNNVIKIDFNSLKAINPDTIAYLKVNNTSIEYIVVKGKDNDYYLNHNFEKDYNIAGWIFADYKNKFDETDNHLIIYGHNTKDGSMFGTLNNILNKEWYENQDNHIITLITENGTYYYEVFSTYSTQPTIDYLQTEFKNSEEYNLFINKLKEKSEYNYNKELSKDDKILTLSSCLGRGEKRVVLHSKLIK